MGRQTCRGFTLIEILVGLMITVMIIGAAYSTYLAATGAWEKSRSRTVNFQQARAALDVIDRCVRAALPPDDNGRIEFAGDSYVIKDTEFAADELRFTTTGMIPNPRRSPMPDLAEVTFYLTVNEELGEPALMMRRRPFAHEDEEFPAEEDELASNVLEFDVQYYDGVEFLDDWTESELPEAVRVTIVTHDFAEGESTLSFSRTIAPRMR